MNLFLSICFAAGVAGFVYSKMGRRIGYDNGQSVWVTVGVSFVIAFIVFYTVIVWVLHFH